MMTEAHECLRPVIMYLAAACLARLCSAAIAEPFPGCAIEDEAQPLHSHLPENFPDAPGILDNCLQNIYKVNDAAALSCNHQTLLSYIGKHQQCNQGILIASLSSAVVKFMRLPPSSMH